MHRFYHAKCLHKHFIKLLAPALLNATPNISLIGKSDKGVKLGKID